MLENDKLISVGITKISCIFSVLQILMHGDFAKIRNSVRVNPFRAFGIHLSLGHTCLVNLPLHTKTNDGGKVHPCVCRCDNCDKLLCCDRLHCAKRVIDTLNVPYLTVNDLNLSHHVTYVE